MKIPLTQSFGFYFTIWIIVLLSNTCDKSNFSDNTQSSIKETNVPPNITNTIPDSLDDILISESNNQISNYPIKPIQITIQTLTDKSVININSIYNTYNIDCNSNGNISTQVTGIFSCLYELPGTYTLKIYPNNQIQNNELIIFQEQGKIKLLSISDWGDYSDGLVLFINLFSDSNNASKNSFINNTPLLLTYQTLTDNITVNIPVANLSPYIAEYLVDCNGDGKFEQNYFGTEAFCEFSKKGIHQIALLGSIPTMRLFDKENNYSLISIDQWGNNIWRSMKLFMASAHYAVILAKDAPDLSHVSDMSSMFRGAIKFNSDINRWDVSNVSDMHETFSNAIAFNQPLNKWNTSNVTNMTKMFSGAINFNKNINTWDVSNVKYMSGMFHRAERFNQPLDCWNVSSVEYMADMFAYSKYNHPLNKWDISSLIDPCGMFEFSSNDKYTDSYPKAYFKDFEFIKKVYNRLRSIGRNCDLYYNHRTDPWKYPEDSEYYQYFKDDHDVYTGRF